MVNRKRIQVHRFSYETFKSRIPYGMVLDHICKTRHCVNPNHLQIVDMRTNILRGSGLSAENARKIKCKNGHDFSSENTLVYKQKYGFGRQCLICKRERNRVHMNSVRRKKGIPVRA